MLTEAFKDKKAFILNVQNLLAPFFSIVIAISTLMVELHILVHNLMISTDISTTKSTKNTAYREQTRHNQVYGSTAGVKQAARLII